MYKDLSPNDTGLSSLLLKEINTEIWSSSADMGRSYCKTHLQITTTGTSRELVGILVTPFNLFSAAVTFQHIQRHISIAQSLLLKTF